MCSGARAVTEIWLFYSGQSFAFAFSLCVEFRLREVLSAHTYLLNLIPRSLPRPTLHFPGKAIIDISDYCGSNQLVDIMSYIAQ